MDEPHVADAVWRDFHEAVNLSASELSAWLAQHPEPAEEVATGQQVLAVLHKRRSELTEDDAAVMQVVVEAVRQHQRDSEKQGHPDPSDCSRLLALGHDPHVWGR